jgi:hypothetical protein
MFPLPRIPLPFDSEVELTTIEPELVVTSAEYVNVSSLPAIDAAAAALTKIYFPSSSAVSSDALLQR